MNKYDVLNVVGEGAYGVVLKCKNKDTNEVVAIKKFKESEEDEAVRKTTLREVKILRIMKHENIVQLKEAFRRKGKLYLVFEFIEKSMLDILEEKASGVEPETVRLLTFQLIRAIEYCHRHDVIHRDIKPENLLISPIDNALRLCDFGFARTVQGDQPLTDYVATRWYRAPELLLGSVHYGKDVDLWATGCIMGELTDGQPLFAGESEVDQLFVIQKVLGALTPEHMEMFLRNPRFLGIQYPDVSRPETLEKRYVRKMKPPQMQLLKAVLRMEPRQRLPAREALRAPWFEGIKLPRSLRPPSQSQSQGTRTRPESSSSVAAERSMMGKETPVQASTPARQSSSGGGHHLQMPPQEATPTPVAPSPDPWQQRQPPHQAHEPRGAHMDAHHDHHAQEPRQPREDLRAVREEPRMRGEQPRMEDSRPVYDDRGSMREDLSRSMDLRAMQQDPRLRDDRSVREDSRPLRDDRSFRGDEHPPPSRQGRDDPPPSRQGREDRERGPRDNPFLHGGPPHGGPPPQQLPPQQPPQQQQGHSGRPNPYVLPWEDRGGHEEPMPLEYSNMSQQYGDADDKSTAEGRRSRQARRQGTNDTVGDPRAGDWDGGRLAGDRGTPSGAERGGAPFGFPAGGNPSKGASRGGGGSMGPSMAYGGIFGPGPGSGSGGDAGDRRERGQGVTPPSRQGATAGTGGSEEWPSTQGRAMRSLREHQDSEDDKGFVQRRKPGRHPGGLGNMPAPATRRSPELADPWQEDMLDLEARRLQFGPGGGAFGGGGGGRWGGGGGNDWPGLGPVPGGGPSQGGQGEPLAPGGAPRGDARVRDPRGPGFDDPRPPSQPGRDQRMLGELGRRSHGHGSYHGH